MLRYDLMFRRLKEARQGAFVPFVTIGDPSLALSFEIIKTLIDNGADALELGIPFSDPVMDGPIIQLASQRALDAGATPISILNDLRQVDVSIPLAVMCYYNTIHNAGNERFANALAATG